VLQDAGCSLALAVSTEEATRLLEDRDFQVLVSDMGRGERETAGLDLLEWLRGRGIVAPTIIFASLSSVAHHGPRARELGAVLCTSGAASVLNAIAEILASVHGTAR